MWAAAATRQRKGVVPDPRDASVQGGSDTKEDPGPSIVTLPLVTAARHRKGIVPLSPDDPGQDRSDKKKMDPRAACRWRTFVAHGALLMIVFNFIDINGDGGGQSYLRMKSPGGPAAKKQPTAKAPVPGTEVEADAGAAEVGTASDGEGGSVSEAVASFPPGCSWECYLANYPVLSEELPHTEEAAVQHYWQQDWRECKCLCEDDPDWRREGNSLLACRDVANKDTPNRCRWLGANGILASDACRETCGSCGPAAPGPKVAPTTDERLKASRKTDPAKPAPAKTQPGKLDPGKPAPAKTEPGKGDPGKPDPGKPVSAESARAKPDPAKADLPKAVTAKPAPGKPAPAKPAPAKHAPAKHDRAKPAPAKPAPAKPAPAKPAPG